MMPKNSRLRWNAVLTAACFLAVAVSVERAGADATPADQPKVVYGPYSASTDASVGIIPDSPTDPDTGTLNTPGGYKTVDLGSSQSFEYDVIPGGTSNMTAGGISGTCHTASGNTLVFSLEVYATDTMSGTDPVTMSGSAKDMKITGPGVPPGGVELSLSASQNSADGGFPNPLPGAQVQNVRLDLGVTVTGTFSASLSDPDGTNEDSESFLTIGDGNFPPSEKHYAACTIMPDGFGPGDISGASGSDTSSGGTHYGSGGDETHSDGISSGGYGDGLSTSMTFTNSIYEANDVSDSSTMANQGGVGWDGLSFPTLSKSGSLDAYVVSKSGDNLIYFVNDGSGHYLPRMGDVHDQFSGGVIDSRGNALSYDLPALGEVKYINTLTDPYGHSISFNYDSHGRLTSISRSVTLGGHTTVETFTTTLIGTGVNAGRPHYVILTRAVDGGTAVVVRKVTYDYYAGTGTGADKYGNQGDLRSVVITDAADHTIDSNYYRYYTPDDKLDGSGNVIGYTHGLKFAFNSASFSRLVAANGDPTTTDLSDTAVAVFATKYREYNLSHEVTLAQNQGSGCSCSGSAGQGTFAYGSSFNNNSGYSDSYNNWQKKTTETLPDGNENIVYTNYVGAVMLKVSRIYSDPSNHTSSHTDYPHYTHYDSSGRVDWTAEPSAFVADGGGKFWDDTKNDLVDLSTGNASYIADGAGLVHRFTYASSTTATSTSAGDVAGYQSGEYIRHGETATDIPVNTVLYKSHTDSNGVTIYYLASSTVYRNDTDSSGPTTTVDCTFYSGTNGIETRTTTKPVISTGQNGPGGSTGDTTIEYFDTYGHVIWREDPDGYITYSGYDIPTGALIRQVVDVDTSETSDFLSTDSVPSGLTSISGLTHLRLLTVYQPDSLGRTTEVTDPNGNVTYTVYDDPNHEVRTYPGWNSSTHLPTGPTQVTRQDLANNYTETLTMTATPFVSSGVPTGGESIGNIQTLSRTLMDQSGRAAVVDRFFDLSSLTYSTAAGIDYSTTPATITELGSQDTNYYRTTYGYDENGRKDRVVDDLGDVTRTVYDGLGRVISTWVGTDDTPTSGEWSPSNTTGTNLVKISSNEYDSGGVGDSTLTQVTQYLDGTGTNTRVNQMFYDWRDRLVATKKGVSTSESDGVHRPITFADLDNLGEATANYRYDGDGVTVSTSGGTVSVSDSTKLRAKTATSYDDQGRVYQTQMFSVDQSNGTVSTSALTTNSFYDHRGDLIATYSPGGLVKKRVYDGAGRMSEDYSGDGAGDSGWSSASSVSGNNILEQSEYTYDADGNVILTINRSRNHDETATGALGSPTTSPKARVMYSTAYYDAANRAIASVAYGTNGGTAVSAPTNGSSPPSSSDTVLVTSTGYNDAGWADTVTDPRTTTLFPSGVVTKTYYDAAGRVTKTIEAYNSSVNGGNPTSSAGYTDLNRTTTYTYDGLDHTLTLTAVQPTSGASTPSQTTQYVYGVTTSSSDVTLNSLLATVKYPDKSTGSASSSASDQNSFTYDALGEVKTKTDQNGTVHTYSYDVVGRTVKDSVAVASGNPQNVDTSVLALGISFDTAGRPYQLTSYDDPTQTTSGHIMNQVQRGYNGLGQLTGEYQSHSGAVSTGSTPEVQYAYSEMASGANNSRLNSITYPNSRVVYYLYTETGGSNGVSNSISRISAIATSTTRGTNDANVLASYDYLGLSTVIRKNYPIPGLRLDRFGGTSGTYTGLDQFDRVINQEWTDYNVSTGANTTNGDLFKIGHGYDRDSNRLYADNQTQKSAAHAYLYDNLNRLTSDKAGAIKSDKSDIMSYWNTTKQGWALDPLGNPTSQDQVDANAYESQTLNAQNQIVTRKVRSNYPLAPTGDPFTSSSNWQEVDPSGSFSVASDSLTINGVTSSYFTDNSDGSVIILPGSFIGGPFDLNVYASPTGSTPAGAEAGIVFGYKSSSDYWLDAYNYDDGTDYIYHVVSGEKSLIGSGGYLNGGVYCSDEPCWASIPGGFPSGQVGVYSNFSGINFSYLNFAPITTNKEMGTRWITINSSSIIGGGNLQKNDANTPRLVVVRNLRLSKFQTTFGMADPWDGAQVHADMLFNVAGDLSLDQFSIDAGDGSAPTVSSSGSSHTFYSANAPVWNEGSVLWIRATYDGSTLTVKAQSSSSKPSEASWSSISAMYTATGFNGDGGMLGFSGAGDNSIEDFTVNSYNTSTSSYDTTEIEDLFATDASNYVVDTLAYDDNGNLTYDGTQAYAYDAWNRLKTVAHAYRDSGNTLHSGQVFETIGYDAAGRRITQAINGTGAMDCTYDYYLNNQSVIEERNGSDDVIKQHVWGLQYVDEAVQTAINSDPTNSGHQTCDQAYWLCQDANDNVLGLVDSTGTLQERYEYSAYGQRQVFVSAGSNDPGCYTPTMASTRVVTSGSVVEPYGINEVGHQGLLHDEELSLVYNRDRVLNPRIGRFMQEDPLGYVDGLNAVCYESSNPVLRADYSGDSNEVVEKFHQEWGWWGNKLKDFNQLSYELSGNWDYTFTQPVWHPTITLDYTFMVDCDASTGALIPSPGLSGNVGGGVGIKGFGSQSYEFSTSVSSFSRKEKCMTSKGPGEKYIADYMLYVWKTTKTGIDISKLNFTGSTTVKTLVAAHEFKKECPCKCKGAK